MLLGTPLQIVPFPNVAHRRRKYKKHVLERREFSCTEVEYEVLADTFLFGTLGADVLQCKRLGALGDVLRLDTRTGEFGIARGGFIETYYIANPSNHKKPSNYCYLYYECWNITD